MVTCFPDSFDGDLGTCNEHIYVLVGGGRKYPCQEDVKEATSFILNPCPLKTSPQVFYSRKSATPVLSSVIGRMEPSLPLEHNNRWIGSFCTTFSQPYSPSSRLFSSFPAILISPNFILYGVYHTSTRTGLQTQIWRLFFQHFSCSIPMLIT
jgi:hypothetical protein